MFVFTAEYRNGQVNQVPGNLCSRLKLKLSRELDIFYKGKAWALHAGAAGLAQPNFRTKLLVGWSWRQPIWTIDTTRCTLRPWALSLLKADCVSSSSPECNSHWTWLILGRKI